MEAVCARCGEGTWPLTTVTGETRLCRDCWRWVGKLSHDATAVDAMHWYAPPSAHLVLPIHHGTMALAKRDRFEAKRTAAELFARQAARDAER